MFSETDATMQPKNNNIAALLNVLLLRIVSIVDLYLNTQILFLRILKQRHRHYGKIMSEC